MAKKEVSNADLSKKLEIIISELQGLRTEIRQTKEELRKHREQLDDIEEVLQAVSRAVDKDAVTIVEYGRRLVRLERRLT